VTPNTRALAALILANISTDLSATVFEGVRRVEASEAVVFGASGISASARAEFELKPRVGTPDELAEELRTAIEQAVRRAIEGRRRVAIQVSGGLDSSSVLAQAVALARGAKRPEIDAITWSFAGLGRSPHLEELARGWGLFLFSFSRRT
jgi:asparagine synthase (glutamine-hydrolysing)